MRCKEYNSCNSRFFFYYLLLILRASQYYSRIDLTNTRKDNIIYSQVHKERPRIFGTTIMHSNAV